MDAVLHFLLTYGYLVLFAFVLVEQIGLPIPAAPVLLGVGALAGGGQMSLPLAFATVLAAALPPDIVWYELGRRRGARVLGFLCRVSLEPDSCVRRTENLFARQGKRTLLIAKFVPGFSAIATPMAGVVGIPRGPFLLLDSAGALLWSGAWIALGYLFSDALELVASRVDRMGHWAGVIVGGAFVAYVLIKFVQRQLFLRSLRVARITPEDLRRRLDAGDGGLVVIDTRSALDVGVSPYAIPGARWITAEDIGQRYAEIPTDKEIVVYCS